MPNPYTSFEGDLQSSAAEGPTYTIPAVDVPGVPPPKKVPEVSLVKKKLRDMYDDAKPYLDWLEQQAKSSPVVQEAIKANEVYMKANPFMPHEASQGQIDFANRVLGGEQQTAPTTQVNPSEGDVASGKTSPTASTVNPMADVLQGQYVPGGWQSTISGPTRETYEEGFTEERESRIKSIALQKQAEERANGIRQMAFQQAKDETDEQIGRAEGQYFSGMAELKKAQDLKSQADIEADNALDELRKAKVDPNRFYKDKDTATNIGLALSVAMGSFWSTFTNTPNTALEMIDKAVYRDIRAQEDDMLNKRHLSDTALRRAMEKTGDLDKAKALVRMQLLETARLQAQKMGLNEKSAIQSANHEQLMAGLEGMIDNTRADFTMAYANFLRGSEAYRPPAWTGAQLLRSGRENNKLYVPGVGVLPTEEAYKKALVEAKGMAQMQQTYYDIGRIAKEISQAQKVAGGISEAFKSQKQRELEAVLESAMGIRSQALGQGVIHKEEYPRYEKMFGSPNSIWQSPDDAAALAATFGSRVNRDLAVIRKQYNAAPAHVVQMRDPMSGAVERIPIILPVSDEELNSDAFNKPDIGPPKIKEKSLTGK